MSGNLGSLGMSGNPCSLKSWSLGSLVIPGSLGSLRNPGSLGKSPVVEPAMDL